MDNNEILKKLEYFCKEFNISPLRDKTFELLLSTIKRNNIKEILEIGTGVGYSIYKIAKQFPDINITSIERDKDRYNVASNLLKDFNNIKILNLNCFEFNCKEKIFDLIIMDGPKRNQIELFEKLKLMGNKETIFFIDNVDLMKFRGLLNQTNNQKKIIESLDEFKEYLLKNEHFSFEYYNIDDGVLIGKLK